MWLGIGCLHHEGVVGNWRSAPSGHPDPEGFHLGILSAVLKVHTAFWDELPDVGMFWDFGSLFQNPRVDNQEELFKMGLTASNIWYGSSQSTVWQGPQPTKACCLSRRVFLISFSVRMHLTVIATLRRDCTSQRGHLVEVV